MAGEELPEDNLPLWSMERDTGTCGSRLSSMHAIVNMIAATT